MMRMLSHLPDIPNYFPPSAAPGCTLNLFLHENCFTKNVSNVKLPKPYKNSDDVEKVVAEKEIVGCELEKVRRNEARLSELPSAQKIRLENL